MAVWLSRPIVIEPVGRNLPGGPYVGAGVGRGVGLAVGRVVGLCVGGLLGGADATAGELEIPAEEVDEPPAHPVTETAIRTTAAPPIELIRWLRPE